ncbi:DegT/DnrJ/EryC1/StrS aminotransferase family protein [Bacteriovorax sp. Seq25_V]|uniref:DegT/DnrJ/EryC1/StrS family aminotransferase n=1 Tax=Bacteriovorax sp. Seq25_V TaxID=1201288 RepID=UPI00038A0D57|nr:DegT/DnrJ/EryC1/StrS family aminotransferase [Bacteriovorax sp. Seq25_V]EQC45675.1 DegT/DnrJ/EryC1/StrS aminotransferase family protein [Bacteriovorax sp. Seq25_V]
MMPEKKVRIFNIEYEEDFIEEFKSGAENILKKAFLGNDQFVKDFEDKFARYQGAYQSVAVTSGTGALEVALKAIGVKDKYVLLPTNTFIATAIAVENSGGIPVLVDVESKYFGMSYVDLQQKLKGLKDKEIAACILVHIGSHCAYDVEKIVDICKQRGIELIEDCAQGLGATLNSKKVGSFSRFGCFSFFTTKVLAMGEGGAITCNTEEDYQLLKSVRQFGMNLENSISHIRQGSNYKLSEFSALLGVLDLNRLPLRVRRRQEIARLYQDNLNSYLYECIKDSGDFCGSYYKQVVLSKVIDREKVILHCQNNGVAITGGVYYIPIHRQPYFADRIIGDFPVANNFSAVHFCPPCYPELSNEEVLYVCEVLNGISHD